MPGRTCVLPEGWPTVRLQMTGGASQVAKIFADTAAVQAGRKLLTTYVHGTTQSTALTLPPGGSVSVALFATGTGPQALPAGHLAGALPDRRGPRPGPDRRAGRAGAASAARRGSCRSSRAAPPARP